MRAQTQVFLLKCSFACSGCHRQGESAKSPHALPQLSWASWTALCSFLLAANPALAEEGLKYDPGSGAEVVKKVAGAAYVVLLAVFAIRLLTKRAKFATGEASAILVCKPIASFWCPCIAAQLGRS